VIYTSINLQLYSGPSGSFRVDQIRLMVYKMEVERFMKKPRDKNICELSID